MGVLMHLEEAHKRKTKDAIAQFVIEFKYGSAGYTGAWRYYQRVFGTKSDAERIKKEAEAEQSNSDKQFRIVVGDIK